MKINVPRLPRILKEANLPVSKRWSKRQNALKNAQRDPEEMARRRVSATELERYREKKVRSERVIGSEVVKPVSAYSRLQFPQRVVPIWYTVLTKKTPVREAVRLVRQRVREDEVNFGGLKESEEAFCKDILRRYDAIRMNNRDVEGQKSPSNNIQNASSSPSLLSLNTLLQDQPSHWPEIARQMTHSHLVPDRITFLTIIPFLGATKDLSALLSWTQVLFNVVRVNIDTHLAETLLQAYADCDCTDIAPAFFTNIVRSYEQKGRNGGEVSMTDKLVVDLYLTALSDLPNLRLVKPSLFNHAIKPTCKMVDSVLQIVNDPPLVAYLNSLKQIYK